LHNPRQQIYHCWQVVFAIFLLIVKFYLKHFCSPVDLNGELALPCSTRQAKQLADLATESSYMLSRMLIAMIAASGMLSSLGCAMCNQCGDNDFTFFGGVRPRAQLASGRVGSAFDDAEGTQHFSDEEAPLYDEAMEGEIIEGELLEPEEEILPVPMNSVPSESTIQPEAELTEPQLDSPPTTSTPPARARRRANPEAYLP
jgi:hypothetical protein